MSADRNQPAASREAPVSVSGVMAMTGLHARASKPFWADAWDHVTSKLAARLALVWISIVVALAILAPVIASGHPLVLREFGPSGELLGVSSPLFDNLRPGELFGLVLGLLGLVFFVLPLPLSRQSRLAMIFAATLQGGLTILIASILELNALSRDPWGWLEAMRDPDALGLKLTAGFVFAGPFALLAIVVPIVNPLPRRIVVITLTALLAVVSIGHTWGEPDPVFDYRERERTGEIQAVYTLVPFSPFERQLDRDARNRSEGTSLDETLAKRVVTPLRPLVGPLPPDQLDRVPPELDRLPLDADQIDEFEAAYAEWRAQAESPTRADVQRALERIMGGSGARYWLGTDGQGQDVLAHLIHACRLSISIGLISTGIAVTIGIIIGSLMGYFGGLVDLLLYRLVEIVQGVPVLFLLIIAAGVLPKNVYVMMAIIGCFGWTGDARFIRAEFLKLRKMDFVQSAQAVGLPLRSILFKHMLPNGITPVLVNASFAIAAAILFESALSFLGLGPPDQASWGKLIASAIGEAGVFYHWLAVYPTLAIFLTVLSFVLLGEAFRDAIDPKRKKARV
ncbi:MAG: ABC transporter permease [Planctomycetota bacterium]